jgi:PAS domain S-box-containing protein
MLISNRIVRLLLESAELHGVDCKQVMTVLGSNPSDMLADGTRLEWGTIAATFDEVGRLVDGDVAKLRAIGRDMQHGKTPDIVRDVARGILTPRGLYRFIDRWVTPAYPHFRLYYRFLGNRRLEMRAEVPEPHAASLAFFEVMAGRIIAIPELLDLPPCEVIEERVTERSADLALQLPRHESIPSRVRHTVRALLSRNASRKGRERQRQSLADSIEALQRARDELRVLLDRLPDLVVVHRGGKVAWVNQAFIRALGFERLEELAGASLVDLVTAPFKPTVAARLLEPYDEPTGRGPPLLNEVCLVARDGSEVRVEVAPGQSVVFDGLPSRLLVGRDVTERVRMQQRLIAMDRLASVGLLAAGVAHEVNNPLAYVLNNIELARKIAGVPEEAETSRAVLAVALEGVDRIRAIVRDLLLLSRGSELRGESIDLRAVVESTLALAAREIEQRAQLVTAHDSAPEVDASGPRFAQVLLNLVSNALEAMRGQPLEQSILRVETKKAADGRFLLEVSDTGRGIPTSDLRRIFEPFFTTKGAAEGTGLGLAIAQRLVDDMGGEINVESREGKGTTFRVFLPRSPSK